MCCTIQLRTNRCVQFILVHVGSHNSSYNALGAYRYHIKYLNFCILVQYYSFIEINPMNKNTMPKHYRDMLGFVKIMNSIRTCVASCNSVFASQEKTGVTIVQGPTEQHSTQAQRKTCLMQKHIPPAVWR